MGKQPENCNNAQNGNLSLDKTCLLGEEKMAGETGNEVKTSQTVSSSSQDKLAENKTRKISVATRR